MATARKFVLGAVVAAKSNRAKGISSGQFLVVHKITDPNKAADLLLFPSKEDADAVAAHVKAGVRGGPTKDAHDAAMANVVSAPALKDFDIRRLQDVSAAWRGMLEAAPRADSQDDDTPEPLVGAKVLMEMPIFDGGAFICMHSVRLSAHGAPTRQHAPWCVFHATSQTCCLTRSGLVPDTLFFM